jgi:PAS domain S-box-containing protein
MRREQALVSQFDVLLDTLPLEVALLDNTGQILAVNKFWRNFAVQNGLKQAHAAVGQNYLSVCFQSTGKYSRLSNQAGEGIASVLNGEEQEFELDYPCHAPGEARWFKMRVRPVEGNSGHVLVIHQDITEEKCWAMILELESQVMQMIAANEPLVTMYERLITGMENLLPDSLASILLLDEDGRHIRHALAPGLPEGYNKALDGIVIDENVGSCGTAMYLREPVICADIREDPKWGEYRELALEAGLLSCWSVPVLGTNNSVLVSFALYHKYPRTPSREELDLIQHAAKVLGLAIERKRNEESLQASIQRFRGLYSNAAAGILMADTRGRLLQANPAFCKMLGYSEEELLGREIFAFTHEQDAEQSRRKMRALLAGEYQSYELEKRYLHKQGWYVWGRISVSRMNDNDGNASSLIAVCENIHAYKLAQQQLEETERRFRYVAQATVDAIWDWDLTTDKIWWSTGFYQLFGYTPEQISPYSSSWKDGIHPGDKDEVLDGIMAVIQGTEMEWSAEYRFRRNDGSYAQVKDKGYVMRDEQGKALRMVGGMSDITKEHLLEEQLRRAQKLESIGQLTGGIAHDFNNILTVIMGNAELLIEMHSDNPEGDGKDELLETAELILSAGQSGADLTQRLLAFARRQPLSPDVVDINRLVSDMDPLLRRTLGDHIEIEWIRAAGLWHAVVDPSQLQNALLNLCINAVDAMPDGGKLTVETANIRMDDDYAQEHLEIRAGQYVMIGVSDTGIGMDDVTIQKAFEPFFTTKRKGKGTGLGLSMVFGFVKQSEGHINIYSEPGKGTIIRLYLPKATGKQPPVPIPRDRYQCDISGTERVLLVEDDTMVRKFAEDVLSRAGYRVFAASHGQQALELLERKGEMSMLITDVVMPGMSGRELAEKVATAYPRMKVLYISGYTENAIVHHGRLDEGVQLLNKPFRRVELLRKVRAILTE